MPKGVSLTADEDFTVATIVMPTQEVEEAQVADTAAPTADAAAPAEKKD